MGTSPVAGRGGHPGFSREGQYAARWIKTHPLPRRTCRGGHRHSSGSQGTDGRSGATPQDTARAEFKLDIAHCAGFGAAEASAEFSQFRQHSAVAVGTIGNNGQTTHEIPGLGDEAVWTPLPGGVYLRKGRYSVQVNQPAAEEVQIRTARKILGQ